MPTTNSWLGTITNAAQSGSNWVSGASPSSTNPIRPPTIPANITGLGTNIAGPSLTAPQLYVTSAYGTQFTSSIPSLISANPFSSGLAGGDTQISVPSAPSAPGTNSVSAPLVAPVFDPSASVTNPAATSNAPVVPIPDVGATNSSTPFVPPSSTNAPVGAGVPVLGGIGSHGTNQLTGVSSTWTAPAVTNALADAGTNYSSSVSSPMLDPLGEVQTKTDVRTSSSSAGYGALITKMLDLSMFPKPGEVRNWRTGTVTSIKPADVDTTAPAVPAAPVVPPPGTDTPAPTPTPTPADSSEPLMESADTPAASPLVEPPSKSEETPVAIGKKLLADIASGKKVDSEELMKTMVMVSMIKTLGGEDGADADFVRSAKISTATSLAANVGEKASKDHMFSEKALPKVKGTRAYTQLDDAAKEMNDTFTLMSTPGLSLAKQAYYADVLSGQAAAYNALRDRVGSTPMRGGLFMMWKGTYDTGPVEMDWLGVGQAMALASPFVLLAIEQSIATDREKRLMRFQMDMRNQDRAHDIEMLNIRGQQQLALQGAVNEGSGGGSTASSANINLGGAFSG